MFRWLMGKGARPARVKRELATIDPDQWAATLAQHYFLTGLSPQEEAALFQRVGWLLASKSFIGAQGLSITPEILLSIAAQAALPIINLDPAVYEGWTEIIIYPGGFLIPRSEMDESGVVHEYMQEAAGEAWEGGPVILSWEDCGPGQGPDINVVIHEFAHKLDLYHSEADGIPWLGQHGPQLTPRMWGQTLDAVFDDFCSRLDEVEAAIPPDVDPESDAAEPWYQTLPLDPYAATDKAEFFAVSSEAFFVNPAPLAGAYPDWYALLSHYYRQDPLRRLSAGAIQPSP
ncbi:M90 family metallopeptidase [Achromobacter sp. F4_2707]|uniref:M90 family metallopeptidase n=1 Tax=Achromobacter sp. F4_2707 TaxID=3114286 RepID=UPI0039C616F0